MRKEAVDCLDGLGAAAQVEGGGGEHSAIIILVSSQSSQIQMRRDHSATSFASSQKFGGEMHHSQYQVFVMSQEDKSRSRVWGRQQLIGSSTE